MSQLHRPSKVRVILDANVLINHLIGQGNVRSTVNRAFRLALGDQFEIVVPDKLLVELRNAPRKPRLAGMLTSSLVEELIDTTLAVVGIFVPTGRPLDQPISRDSGDDYPIKAAIYNDVDIIVSGDKDLLVLGDVLERPRIMTPADFVAEFETD